MFILLILLKLLTLTRYFNKKQIKKYPLRTALSLRLIATSEPFFVSLVIKFLDLEIEFMLCG